METKTSITPLFFISLPVQDIASYQFVINTLCQSTLSFIYFNDQKINLDTPHCMQDYNNPLSVLNEEKRTKEDASLTYSRSSSRSCSRSPSRSWSYSEDEKTSWSYEDDENEDFAEKKSNLLGIILRLNQQCYTSEEATTLLQKIHNKDNLSEYECNAEISFILGKITVTLNVAKMITMSFQQLQHLITIFSSLDKLEKCFPLTDELQKAGISHLKAPAKYSLINPDTIYYIGSDRDTLDTFCGDFGFKTFYLNPSIQHNTDEWHQLFEQFSLSKYEALPIYNHFLKSGYFGVFLNINPHAFKFNSKGLIDTCTFSIKMVGYHSREDLLVRCLNALIQDSFDVTHKKTSSHTAEFCFSRNVFSSNIDNDEWLLLVLDKLGFVDIASADEILSSIRRMYQAYQLDTVQKDNLTCIYQLLEPAIIPLPSTTSIKEVFTDYDNGKGLGGRAQRFLQKENKPITNLRTLITSFEDDRPLSSSEMTALVSLLLAELVTSPNSHLLLVKLKSIFTLEYDNDRLFSIYYLLEKNNLLNTQNILLLHHLIHHPQTKEHFNYLIGPLHTLAINEGLFHQRSFELLCFTFTLISVSNPDSFIDAQIASIGLETANILSNANLLNRKMINLLYDRNELDKAQTLNKLLALYRLNALYPINTAVMTFIYSAGSNALVLNTLQNCFDQLATKNNLNVETAQNSCFILKELNNYGFFNNLLNPQTENYLLIKGILHLTQAKITDETTLQCLSLAKTNSHFETLCACMVSLKKYRLDREENLTDLFLDVDKAEIFTDNLIQNHLQAAREHNTNLITSHSKDIWATFFTWLNRESAGSLACTSKALQEVAVSQLK